MMIEGTIVSGMGKGAKFLSNKRYLDAIEAQLGFAPYAGTLNISVGAKSAKMARDEAKSPKARTISGFEDNGRRYGGICLRAAKYGDYAVALIYPECTTHPGEIVEIIAKDCMRKKFGLKDGDGIKIEIIA